MAASTKNDLAIKVGVLEKLVDRLTDRLDTVIHRLTNVEARTAEQSFQNLQNGIGAGVAPEADEWAINNLTGEVEKTDPAKVRDDVDALLGN